MYTELDQESLEDADAPERQFLQVNMRQGKYLGQDPQNLASYECPNVILLDCCQTYSGIVDERYRNTQDWRGLDLSFEQYSLLDCQRGGLSATIQRLFPGELRKAPRQI